MRCILANKLIATAMKKDYPFQDNTKKRRYELDLGDNNVAFIDYFITPEGDIVLTHTEVPYEYENRGIGSQLAEKCLEDIKSRGAHVVPQCGFVASYVRRHPEWEDLVSSRYR